MKDKRYKLREAAMVCRTNEIKIRRLILSNVLSAERIPQGEKNYTYLVALDDLRNCPALEVDEALVLALEHHDEDVSSMADEIADLRRRVERLERELALSNTPLSSDTPPPILSAPVVPHRSLQTVILANAPMSGMPDDLVSLSAYSVRHGVNPGTAKSAATGGRLRHKRGKWRVYADGRSTMVEYALDADGRRQFMVMFASLANFRHCDVAACECHEV